MKFSKEIPTKDGYYWFKGPCGFMAVYLVMFMAEYQNNLNPSGMMVLDSPQGYHGIYRWVYMEYEFSTEPVDTPE